MGDGGPIHVEAGIEDPGDDWRPPGRRPSSRRLSRDRSPWRLGIAVAALLGLAAGGLATVLGDGGDRDDGGDRPGPTSEETAPAEPRAVWARATARLGEAGSFAYRGTVRAAAPGPLRPGAWLDTQVTVEGAVLLPQSITREVAVDGQRRAVETVTSGPTAWSRTAPSRDRLATAAWEVVRRSESMRPGWSDRLGVALVMDALRATTNRRMDPPDGSGRRVLHGTVRTTARGPHIEAVPDVAELSLTLDKDGDVVEATLATPAGDDQPLVIELAIDRVGEPGLVTAAHVAEPARHTVATDVLAAEGVEPVELGRIPAGWALTDTQVWAGGDAPHPRGGPTCPGLDLVYEELGAVSGGRLSLRVAPERCRAGKVGRPDWGEPFRAGTFTGTAHEHNGGTQGNVSDGATSVGFETNLPADEAAEALASLEPFDPA